MSIETQMSDHDFQNYQKLIYQSSGIHLNENKKALLVRRLSHRMKTLNLASFESYFEYIQRDIKGEELILLINAISTNKTEFFREKAHFEFLQNTIYPQLLTQHQIRIWCAACSSGQEAYTLAMTLLESIECVERKDIKILATDISTAVLDTAEQGVYPESELQSIPIDIQRKYFLKGSASWEGYYLVKDTLKEMVHFRRLNFIEPFPLSAQFDIIFCRNAMIYFDQPTKEELIQKFTNQLVSGGYFFIGHSETLSNMETPLDYVKPSIYRKPLS